MRVCSWNLWSKGSSLIDRHWLQAARSLQNWNLDIIALQEVDCGWSERSNFADVSKEMADLLGYRQIFYPAINESGCQYGNAILSKVLATESGSVNLSPSVVWDQSNHQTEPRVAGWVRFEKEKVIMITTHLANALYLQSTSITFAQALRVGKLIEELKEQFSDYRIILGGDFNLTPDAEEISLINEVIPKRSLDEPTWPSQPFSYKGWEETPPPAFAIDYLFSNRPLRVWLEKSTISDHLPVLAEY
jgi:endonuclease/exonuclease/phosphatase family metal-dependent hydrolase